MREIAYKNLTSKKYRRRIISISETAEKKGFLTHTQKRFIYIIKKKSLRGHQETQPQFYVTKVSNSNNETEKILFRIKGVMQAVKDGMPLWVYYCHSLTIDIEQPQKESADSK